MTCLQEGRYIGKKSIYICIRIAPVPPDKTTGTSRVYMQQLNHSCVYVINLRESVEVTLKVFRKQARSPNLTVVTRFCINSSPMPPRCFEQLACGVHPPHIFFCRSLAPRYYSPERMRHALSQVVRAEMLVNSTFRCTVYTEIGFPVRLNYSGIRAFLKM